MRIIVFMVGFVVGMGAGYFMGAQPERMRATQAEARATSAEAKAKALEARMRAISADALRQKLIAAEAIAEAQDAAEKAGAKKKPETDTEKPKDPGTILVVPNPE